MRLENKVNELNCVSLNSSYNVCENHSPVTRCQIFLFDAVITSSRIYGASTGMFRVHHNSITAFEPVNRTLFFILLTYDIYQMKISYTKRWRANKTFLILKFRRLLSFFPRTYSRTTVFLFFLFAVFRPPRNLSSLSPFPHPLPRRFWFAYFYAQYARYQTFTFFE